MAEFPRYESKGQLTTQQPSVLAPQTTAGKGLEAVSKVAGVAEANSLKWINAVDTIQKTTATANFKTGMLDILNRAQNDPDYNNSKAYTQEIEKLRKNSLKGFATKGAEAETALNLDYESRVADIQVQNLYKKKMIDVGQTAALQLVDAEVNNPTESSLANIQKELNKQVAAGIFDHKDAYQLLRKANDDLGVNRINKDLYQAQTPEEVDAVTQGITSGAYERGGVTIEPDKKKSLLDIADRARANTEKKIQAQQVEALAKNRMETIVGLSSGELKFDNLNMVDIAEYDPQLAGTLNKVKDFMVNYNPKLPPKEQAITSAGVSPNQIQNMRNYARSITDTFLQADNQKLSEFVLRELDKKGDGLTSSVKIAAFANLAALKANVNNPQNKQDAEKASQFNAIKSGVKFLQASNPYLSQEAIGDFIVRSFLSGAKTKAEAMAEANAVLSDKIIDRYKSVSKLPSIPNKIVDGEASVEDLHSGLNEEQGDESFSGNQDNSVGSE